MAPGTLRRPLILGLFLYIGVLALRGAAGAFDADPPAGLRGLAYFPDLTLRGLVVSPLKEDGRGEKVLVLVERLGWRAAASKAQVYLPRGAPGNRLLRPGSRLACRGKLRLPRPARNPGDFDERAFLGELGVSWILTAQECRAAPGPAPWRWRPWAWAEGSRRSFEDSLRASLPDEEARVLTALALGYKRPLPRELNRAFQDAGVIHLLVPSGAKVAFVLLALAALGRALGLGPWGRLALSAGAGTFYCLMVGGDPPYARALIAGLALELGLVVGRDAGPVQACALSAWAVLLWEPRALFTAGFQMTYLAAAGLLAALPSVRRAAGAWPAWAGKAAIVGAMTLIVQAMLWPVFANVFGRASLAGLGANLLLVPLAGPMMAAAFGLWGAGALGWARAASCLAWGAARLLWFFEAVSRLAAGLPGAAVELSPMGPIAVAVYYLLLFALLHLPRPRVAAGLALAGLALWGGAALGAPLLEPPLRVVFLRVPGAAAAVVRRPGGREWLLARGAPAGPLLRALKALGIWRLERLTWCGRGPRSEEALARLRERLWVEALERPARLPELCRGAACFSFDPPGARRAGVEFDIIAFRLRRRAVAVSTDGAGLSITYAIGREEH